MNKPYYLSDKLNRKLGSFYFNSNFLGKTSNILQRSRNTWIPFDSENEAIEHKNTILKEMIKTRQNNIIDKAWNHEQEKNYQLILKWMYSLTICRLN